LIKDSEIAERYFEQWRELVKDASDYPDGLLGMGDAPKAEIASGTKVTAWYAPDNRIGPAPKKGQGNKYEDHPDIKAARAVIQNAQEGILFLVFNPIYRGTRLNDILDLLKKPRVRNNSSTALLTRIPPEDR
jgi:hypothetical protein